MRAVGRIVIWPVLNFIIPVLNVCTLVLRHNICKFWQKKKQNLFKPGIKPKGWMRCRIMRRPATGAKAPY
jgi:hypothetical protein